MEGRSKTEQTHGTGKASVKPPEGEGWGGEGASPWGPQCYPVLHRDPAGTGLTNAMHLPREVQPCLRMAVPRSAGNNHSSPCLFLASLLFTSLLLPEKQTLNLQHRLAQRWFCLCVQSRMEAVANRTLTSLLCFVPVSNCSCPGGEVSRLSKDPRKISQLYLLCTRR